MRPPAARQVSAWLTAVQQGCPLEGEMTEAALKTIVRRCFSVTRTASKASPAATSAAMRTLAHMEGQTMEGKMVVRNVTRLLANWHFIMEGMEVPEWDGTRTTSDVVVLGVARVPPAPGSKPSYVVAMKLKTGLPAGIISCGSFTEASMAYFLQHCSGTAKLECAVEEMAGMQARCSISHGPEGWRVYEWTCTDQQKKHNRDISERRMDIRKCKLAPMPCNVCTKTIHECPLAVWLPKKKEK